MKNLKTRTIKFALTVKYKNQRILFSGLVPTFALIVHLFMNIILRVFNILKLKIYTMNNGTIISLNLQLMVETSISLCSCKYMELKIIQYSKNIIIQASNGIVKSIYRRWMKLNLIYKQTLCPQKILMRGLIKFQNQLNRNFKIKSYQK